MWRRWRKCGYLATAYLAGKLNMFRAVQHRGKALLLLTMCNLSSVHRRQSTQGDSEDSTAVRFFAIGISGLKL